MQSYILNVTFRWELPVSHCSTRVLHFISWLFQMGKRRAGGGAPLKAGTVLINDYRSGLGSEPLPVWIWPVKFSGTERMSGGGARGNSSEWWITAQLYKLWMVGHSIVCLIAIHRHPGKNKQKKKTWGISFLVFAPSASSINKPSKNNLNYCILFFYKCILYSPLRRRNLTP